MSFELNHSEYGINTSEYKPINILFQPSDFGILDQYSVIKEIYKVQLSPTIISLTAHKETNLVRLHLLTSFKL